MNAPDDYLGEHGESAPSPGVLHVSLRDYFATHAMVMLGTLVLQDKHSTNPGRSLPEGIALDAYGLADAMLSVREE